MSISAGSHVSIDSSTSRWRNVGDSVVVMDLTNSTYFAVEGSVAHVWPQLVDGASITQMASGIAAEFDVDVEMVVTDLVELFADLERRGVVTVDAAD